MKFSMTILAAAIATLYMNAAQAQQNPPGINPEHYACYRVSPAQRINPRQVGLLDQFGRGVAVVVQEMFLCAPVSKNEQPVRDERTHLLCYLVKTNKAANKAVLITNQFGRFVMKVGPLQQLCVPSIKTLRQ